MSGAAAQTILMLAALMSAGLLLAAVSGCDDPPRPHRGPAPIEEPPDSEPRVRRPERRHYIARRGERCELYWENGSQKSVRRQERCPAVGDLADGERMRLAGNVCFRESEDPVRNGPVRCAKQLFYIERDADGGPYYLPAKE